MYVYRLERNNGYGVFMSGEYPRNDDALHGIHYCSVRLDWRNNWRFACESVDKLIEYFGSGFTQLLADGAVLVEYKVRKNHVKYGYVNTGNNTLECIEVAFNIDKSTQKAVIMRGTNRGKIFSNRDYDLTGGVPVRL